MSLKRFCEECGDEIIDGPGATQLSKHMIGGTFVASIPSGKEHINYTITIKIVPQELPHIHPLRPTSAQILMNNVPDMCNTCLQKRISQVFSW